MDYPLTLFYDGACPICRFEIAQLQARNQAGRLVFIDISAADFVATSIGKTPHELAAVIHARRADGRFVTGVEVFQLCYRAVGLGWLVAPVSWWPFSALLRGFYRWFARNRHGVSRRVGFVFVWLLARQTLQRIERCDKGTCTGHL
ncbi:MAG: DUF393 domain-containing protein [Betaproteobacteria bacterium]|nr:DUF393 domain-containing protein [Betaproteobacteria bacterium]